MVRGKGKDDWESSGQVEPPSTKGLSGSEAEMKHDPSWHEGDLLKDQLKSGQNMPAAIMVGALAAALGLGAWLVLTWQTGAIFSPMALVIGYLVGYSVRWAGQGSSPGFGIVAAFLTAAASLAALALSVAILVAQQEEIPFGEALEGLEPGLLFEMLSQVVSPLTIVIVLFALYESYRVAISVRRPVELPKGEHDEEFERGPEDEHGSKS